MLTAPRNSSRHCTRSSSRLALRSPSGPSSALEPRWPTANELNHASVQLWPCGVDRDVGASQACLLHQIVDHLRVCCGDRPIDVQCECAVARLRYLQRWRWAGWHRRGRRSSYNAAEERACSRVRRLHHTVRRALRHPLGTRRTPRVRHRAVWEKGSGRKYRMR